MMWKWCEIKCWVTLLVALPFVSGKPQNYHTYSYGGVNVHKWQGVDPLFSFHSRRAFPTKSDGAPAFPSQPAFPTAPHGFSSSDFPFVPEFESPNFGLIPDPFSKKKNKKKKFGGRHFDMESERYGGFGGTGDAAGVGAYEYNTILASPYPNLSKDIFMRKSGKAH